MDVLIRLFFVIFTRTKLKIKKWRKILGAHMNRSIREVPVRP